MTGKNKKQFEDWYFNTHWNIPRHYFYNSPFEMQIGVYLAYYDSLGYEIDIFRANENTFTANLSYWENGDVWNEYNGENFKTRNEAYKEAFKKADEIINGK